MPRSACGGRRICVMDFDNKIIGVAEKKEKA